MSVELCRFMPSPAAHRAVAHVDDRRADLDAAGPTADGGHQWEGRAQLPGKVVHSEISTVSAQLLGRDRQVDGLQQSIGG